jgi:two-component system, OmpR family, sensor histidine kinase KdpD
MPDRNKVISRSARFAFAAMAIAGAVGVALLLWPWIGLENVGLVFLTAIVGIAVQFGLWQSLFATVVSSLCYNFLFTAPYYTFAIAEPKDVMAVLFFTIIAVIVSNVAARARTEANAAMARVRTTELLYSFSRKLVGVGTLDDVLWATAYQTALMLNMRVVLLLPENGSIAVKAGYPPEDRLDERDLAAAQWAWLHNEPAGRGVDTLPDARRLFLPMRTGRAAIGVVGVDRELGPLLMPAERRLLDALIDQSALAIERVYLVADADRVKRSMETERLRSALLTSISHDLRTPLAAVLGASEALRDLSERLSNDQKADLLATIIDESERLNRFIANLLDMTKLESGAIAPNAAMQDLHEVIGSVLRRADKLLAQHRVELDLASDLPMLKLDAVLFEQVLFNLLDNAAKYAPAGTVIGIRSRREDGAVSLQIVDEGAGIPSIDLEHIFDKFFRTRKGDQVRAGTGLGLAISRGFVEAMHGTISAANRSDRSGAVFTVRLPVPAKAEHLGEAA